ncbi:hypothetical protein [Streptomyces sp. NPDC002588]|uniref:hypothetical protein n=1 Tax=Streptomyces sp. NPDC002588 TaxID=3154419 RepID=UPI00332FD0E3
MSFTYSLGPGIPFLLAAASSGGAIAALHLGATTPQGGDALRRSAAGRGGVMQVTGWWGQLIVRLQTLITGFQLPL